MHWVIILVVVVFVVISGCSPSDTPTGSAVYVGDLPGWVEEDNSSDTTKRGNAITTSIVR